MAAKKSCVYFEWNSLHHLKKAAKEVFWCALNGTKLWPLQKNKLAEERASSSNLSLPGENQGEKAERYHKSTQTHSLLANYKLYTGDTKYYGLIMQARGVAKCC